MIIEALVVSLLIAVLTSRRIGLAAGIPATAAVTAGFIAYNGTFSNASPGLNFWFVRSLFFIVPGAILLGASRQRWLARHAWVLIPLGPVVFVGCYVGICAACVKAGVI
jgi:peptidoglycan/LPS O-acetylase OafA/YrhL